MLAATMPIGKHRGRPLSEIDTGYLKWAIEKCEALDHWTRQAIRQELGRRGTRFVAAAVVLSDLEEKLTERVSEDPFLSHQAAGRVSDHVMHALEFIRDKHNIAAVTELVSPGCRVCKGNRPAPGPDLAGVWAGEPWRDNQP